MTTRTVRYLTEEQVRQRAASGRQAFFDILLPGEDDLPVTIADGTAVVRLYDVIDSWGGYWGISASQVAQALDGLPEDITTVELHINSPGGEATEGVAISNLLRQDSRRVVAITDGLCASAASMVAMGADELVMAPGSQLMVHEASGGAWGPADYLEQESRALHHLSDSYAAVYALKAGGSVEQWRAAMLAETWYSPAEAVAVGLAERVLDARTTDDPTARASAHDLRRFAYAGRAKAPAPKHSPAAAVEPAAAGGTTTEEARVSDTLLTNLRQSLGLAEDADEATVMAEHLKAMAALQDLNDAPPAPDAAVIPEGHVAVPQALLDDLRAGASTAVATAKKIHNQERDAFLNDNRAKYAPANRDAWAKEYDRDPEATRAHFASAPDIVSVDPIGRDEDELTPTVDSVRETPAYKNWKV